MEVLAEAPAPGLELAATDAWSLLLGALLLSLHPAVTPSARAPTSHADHRGRLNRMPMPPIPTVDNPAFGVAR